jgi:hypothetical protein
MTREDCAGLVASAAHCVPSAPGQGVASAMQIMDVAIFSFALFKLAKSVHQIPDSLG